MIAGEPGLEQRLEARLSPPAGPRSPGAWLSIWGLLILLGFRYRLAFATRAVLAAGAAVAFWRGRPIVGGILLAAFLTYLFQIPLIVGIAREHRDRRRRN